VFYVSYMLSELRRRRGRTILTALGLAVGVALVVTVTALSTGLDRAQAKVLKPLTGVGTDISVTRPIRFTGGNANGGFAGPRLTPQERDQLRSENGPRRFGFGNLGKPGTHFSRDSFVSTSQLTFAQSRVAQTRALAGVRNAAGGLTLSAVHIEGTVPSSTQGGGGFGGPPAGGQLGPRNIDVSSISVAGVDQTHPGLGGVTSGQLQRGRYFSRAGSTQEAILDIGYARRKNLGLGDSITLGGKTFKVIGLARTPLGGQSSDVYVKLAVLQKLADRAGRVNALYVRAASSADVNTVAASVRKSFPGASVTTAKDLADRISGSLVDAKNLTSKLGTALEIVGLLAAFLIASLLTLSSVTKRIRELGTLKALGWSQRLVVRQVTGESMLQGLLGGVLGIVLGIGGAALVGAFAPSLTATVASAATQGPRLFGPFGQGSIAPSSTSVALTAPVSVGLLVLAVGLAVVGGLLAGAVGGLRAARLRPADALRHID
jgi:ABC-type antimicrobial peptide transport system permease subunit